MSETGGHGRTLATAFALVAVAAASVWLRWPGLTEGGFASHDVAGILHEAMVLHDGGLPYVDTIELKAPGTFWLAKWLAGPAGTDIARFQGWAGVFGVTSLLAVGLAGWRLMGAGTAIGAAVLYGLHDLHLDSIDANYVTWAQTPMVLAAAAVLIVPTLASARTRWAVLLCAGVLAGLATLCKRPAGVVVLVVLVVAWLDARERGDVPKTLLVVLAGVVLSHAPIVLTYAAAGELSALWDGYFVSKWGLAYVAEGGRPSGVDGVREGVLATTYFLALPLALTAFSIASSGRAKDRALVVRLSCWAALALVAAWVGFRFYKGYFLAVLPPLCLLAAAPWGLLGGQGPLRRPWLRGLVLLPALVLVARQAMFLDQLRRDRTRAHDEGGRTIADHIGPRTEDGDRIWVWGWHLWDVYAFTGRRSASRVYKSIGLLTPPNDDTWRTAATKTTFVDGEAATILLEDLQRERPAWIVLGSTVPVREFDALRALLRADYRRDRRVHIGRVQFWHRKDRPRD